MKKKLIEVALPLEAINKESAREKSIRHGHPSTLHLWWARRPLAACRAVLFASLVDDPSSHPDKFPTEEAQEQERQRLFDIIGKIITVEKKGKTEQIVKGLVSWDDLNNPEVIEAAQREIARYTQILDADGSPMRIRTALQLINQMLDEFLTEQEGEFDADTRWALTWFEQNQFNEGLYGDAETLSKAKNTSVQGLVNGGILTAKSGKVRLLRRDELPDNWKPATDTRTSDWETTQHLIRTLDQKGETGAATMLSQLGSRGEIARDLAYRLYNICDRKNWTQEAIAYNSLVQLGINKPPI
jgi:adenine-specific DNA methylase